MNIAPTVGGTSRTKLFRQRLPQFPLRLTLLALAIAGGGGSTRAAQTPELEDPGVASNAPTATERQRQNTEWYRKTLVLAYVHAGDKNPSWDEAARQCLASAAALQAVSGSLPTSLLRSVADNSRQAVEAGCRDPLVVYLHTRYRARTRGTAEERRAEIRRTVEALQSSQYPAIQKFHANVYAAEQMLTRTGTKSITPPEAHAFRRAAQGNALALFDDPGCPSSVAVDACLALLRTVEKNATQYQEFYRALEKPLFARWPKEGGAFLVRGVYYIKSAWFARGGGYADTVSEQGWKLFSDRLKLARAALGEAWRLDPLDQRICHNQITVELGMGEKREDMEDWFRRGMELDPNNYDLCRHKLYYLEPKWHGSPEAMIEFGRECVQSKRWGGRVPLILVDAYEKLVPYVAEKNRDAMWANAEVWADVRSAYERYFELNPRLLTTRNNYALHAFRCGQWEVFLRQIALLRSAVNPAVFGGQARLEEMLTAARARSGSK